MNDMHCVCLFRANDEVCKHWKIRISRFMAKIWDPIVAQNKVVIDERYEGDEFFSPKAGDSLNANSLWAPIDEIKSVFLIVPVSWSPGDIVGTLRNLHPLEDGEALIAWIVNRPVAWAWKDPIDPVYSNYLERFVAIADQIQLIPK